MPGMQVLTLLRDASRCPICHANPGDQYWAAVRDAERAEALRVEAAAKEWKRTESERAAKAARLAAAERRVKFGGNFWAVYAAYLLPIVCVATALILKGRMEQFIAKGWENVLLLCPVLTWISHK